MGKDWYEPRDKGPTIEEPNRHRKKANKKKPFVLECRYIGPEKTFMSKYWATKRQWHTYGRYATERARQTAFDALSVRLSHFTQEIHWEYRLA